MTAGMPGVGLSGVFVLITALLIPVLQRGSTRSGVVPIAVGSAAMIVAVWTVMRGTLHSDGTTVWTLPILPAGLSLLILAVVVGLPEVLLRTIGTRPTPLPPPVQPRNSRVAPHCERASSVASLATREHS